MTAAEAVEVWRADLDPPARIHEQLALLLSTEEQETAGRFWKGSDARRFTDAHGYLRLLLSRRLGVAPEDLEFAPGPAGKPRLVGCGSDNDLRFNLSHSGDVLLVALARGREVGIDVERIDTCFDWDQLARTYFSTGERAAVARQTGRARMLSCFEIWTRKEALLKAIGSGIGGDLATVDVMGGSDVLTGAWTLQSIDLGSDYRAAIAAQGHNVPINPPADIAIPDAWSADAANRNF